MATATRDRSETPETVAAGIEAANDDDVSRETRIDKATQGVDEIVITRAIHFYPGGPVVTTPCYAGTITGIDHIEVEDAPTIISAYVLPRSRFEPIMRTGGAAGEPMLLSGLPMAEPDATQPNVSAHLSRDCPFGR